MKSTLPSVTLKSSASYQSPLQDYYYALDSEIRPNDNVYIFPPLTHLSMNNHKFTLGAQSAYPALSGAFTGEITLNLLQEFHINTLIIGHSERRRLIKNSSDFCKEKFEFFSQYDFQIIYCIGEDAKVAQNGKDAAREFLKSQLNGINLNYPKLIIAYEPIWAIGTGDCASLEKIEEIHSFIKNFTDAKILYGGSINTQNAPEILHSNLVDGLLIGNTSLDIKSFIQIIREARDSKNIKNKREIKGKPCD